MGIIVNKSQDDDELTRRINADLREKSERTSGVQDPDAETPDFADDSEYVKNFKKTSKFGWVWIVLIVLALGAIVAILI